MKTERLTITLPADTLAEIKRLAREEGRSDSAQAARIIEAGLKDQK